MRSLYIVPKNTDQRSTAKQEKDRLSDKNPSFAAATSKEAKEGEKIQTYRSPHQERLTASAGQKKQESDLRKSNPTKEKGFARVDYIVNKDWKSLIPLIESTGVLVNKTITSLLKLYPSEKVEAAIAILKERKRDQHIPNLSGYFVSALKGDWASNSLAVEDESDREVDKGAVFRHWYDLARQLGVRLV